MNSKNAGRLLTALALLAIGVLTLQPRPELAQLSARTPVWCLVCGSQGLVDVVLNVMLFVPLGLGLGLMGVRPRRVMLFAALTTLTIELLQLQIVSGRDASLSDLLTNTLGAGVGLLAARHWRRLAFPTPPAAARLMAVWAALVLGITGMTGVSIAPSMPSPPYWGQWTPQLGGLLQHHGTVESTQVEDIAMQSRRSAESAALADSLADGEVSAVVTATLAGRPRGTAPIFRMVDGIGNQALLVAQDGRDLIVETGTVSERLRLRALTVRVRGAMPERERVRISVASDGRGYAMEVHGMNGPVRTISIDRSVTWGWALLLPYISRLDDRRGVFDALWLGALLLPLGWWAPSLSNRVAAAALVGALLILALAGVPALLGLTAAAAPAWAGGAVGAGIGWMAALIRR